MKMFGTHLRTPVFVVLVLIVANLFFVSEAVAALSSLTVSENGNVKDLNFSSNTFTYDTTIDIVTSQIQVNAVLADSYSSFTVDAPGLSVPTTGTSGVNVDIPISSNMTTIVMVITAQDDTQQTYKIVLRKNGICGRTMVSEYEDGTINENSTILIDAMVGISAAQTCAGITVQNVETLTFLTPKNFNEVEYIIAIPNGTFAGMKNLRTLILKDNKLTSLPADIFSDLESLQVLELQNNELTSLPAGIFSGLDNLERLDLQGNPFTSLPTDIFSGLNLRKLYLPGSTENVIGSGSDFLDNLSRIEGIQILGASTVTSTILEKDTTKRVVVLLETLPSTGTTIMVNVGTTGNVMVMPSSLVWTADGSTTQSLSIVGNARGEATVYFEYTESGQTFQTTPFLYQIIEVALSMLTVSENGENKILDFSSSQYNYVVDVDVTTQDVQVNASVLSQQVGFSITATNFGHIEGVSGTDVNIPLTGTQTSSGDITTITIVVTLASSVKDTYEIAVRKNGICGRLVTATTPTVVIDTIVSAVAGKDDCSEIAIADLEMITELDLSSKNISAIPKDTFAGLVNLHTLDLSDNQLTYLPPGIFAHTPNLMTIDLSGNPLSGLPTELLDLDSLSTLSVTTTATDSLNFIDIQISGASTLTTTMLITGITNEVEVVLGTPLSTNNFSVAVISTPETIEVSTSSLTWTAGGTTIQSLGVTGIGAGQGVIYFEYIVGGTTFRTTSFLYEVKVQIIVEPMSLTIAEKRETTESLTIQAVGLSPTSTVNVVIQVDNNRLNIVSSPTITLNSTQSETVIIRAIDDGIFYQDEQSVVSFTGENIIQKQVQVFIQENDTLSFSITASDTITEGESIEVLVGVNAVPEAGEVTVNLDADIGLEISASSLLFTTETVVHSIRATATETMLAEANRIVAIRLNAPAYTSASRTITILDNDEVMIMATSSVLTIAEGTTAELTIQAIRQVEQATTEIRLVTTDPRLRISPATVVLSGDTAEQVQIHVLDDLLYYQDENREASVTLAGNNLTPVDISIFIQENDTLSFSITASDTITEGESIEVLVGVNAVPEAGEVTVNLDADIGLEISASSLLFTTETVVHSIRATATETMLAEANRIVAIRLNAPAYTSASRTITILDNDEVMIMATSSVLTIAEGTTAELTIQAIRQVEQATTEIRLVTTDPRLRISPATVVLSGDTAEQVQIHVLDDLLYYQDENREASVTLAGNNLTPVDISIFIQENDTLTITVRAKTIVTGDIENSRLIIDENSTRSLVVSLGGLPTTGHATITVMISEENLLQVNKSSLIFSNPLSEMEIDVEAINNAMRDGNRNATLTLSGPIGYVDKVLTFSIQDDEAPALEIRLKTFLEGAR